MALIAKRALDMSWREAVARRAGPAARAEETLASFDAARAAGAGEAEAAFRALAECGLLWHVPLPGDLPVTPGTGGHEVPVV